MSNRSSNINTEGDINGVDGGDDQELRLQVEEDDINFKQRGLGGKTPSWQKLKRLDSLDAEFHKLNGRHHHASKVAKTL